MFNTAVPPKLHSLGNLRPRLSFRKIQLILLLPNDFEQPALPPQAYHADDAFPRWQCCHDVAPPGGGTLVITPSRVDA